MCGSKDCSFRNSPYCTCLYEHSLSQYLGNFKGNSLKSKVSLNLVKFSNFKS